jgi:hypothetical protein
VFEAFNDGNLPPVPIPFGHVEHLGGDDPANNNGFVESMSVGGVEGPQSTPNGDYVLWVGMDVTEPETLEKLERGSIQNVSAWLEPDVHDLKDEGVVWPLALWHVALTDKPQLVDLQPFAAYVATKTKGARNMTEPTTVPVADDSDGDKSKLEELEARLAAAEAQLATAEASRAELETTVAAQADTIVRGEQEKHEKEVETIVAALQGRAVHGLVSIEDGKMVPPAVLRQIHPILAADLPANGKKRVVLSVSRQDEKGDAQSPVDLSVTQMVLDVVNAFAATGVGMLDTAKRGASPSHDPGKEKTPESEREAAFKNLDEYLAEHPEVIR